MYEHMRVQAVAVPVLIAIPYLYISANVPAPAIDTAVHINCAASSVSPKDS